MELLNYPTTLCLSRLLLLKRNDLVQAVLYASRKWLDKVHSITIGLSMERICSNDSYIHQVSLNDLIFFLLYREKITFQYIDPKSILPLSRIDCRLEIGFERLHSLRLPCTWTPLLSIFTESLMNPCRSYNDNLYGTEGVRAKKRRWLH